MTTIYHHYHQQQQRHYHYYRRQHHPTSILLLVLLWTIHSQPPYSYGLHIPSTIHPPFHRSNTSIVESPTYSNKSAREGKTERGRRPAVFIPSRVLSLSSSKRPDNTVVRNITNNKKTKNKKKDGIKSNGSNRRTWLLQSTTKTAFLTASTLTLIPQSTIAAETIGKDPDCLDASCTGVWDGLLADCPHSTGLTGLMGGGGAGCVSSQDDTPGIFTEPWDYSEAPNNSLSYETQMELLIPAIQSVSSQRNDEILSLSRTGRYLRVIFRDGKTSEQSIGEFYFTPNDTTVQFRLGSVVDSSTGPKIGLSSSSWRNMERCEAIRKTLRYQKLTVLRNRKRALLFVESPFDTFGPGSASLGPPAEMGVGEIEGRKEVGEEERSIDLLQGFPKRN